MATVKNAPEWVFETMKVAKDMMVLINEDGMEVVEKDEIKNVQVEKEQENVRAKLDQYTITDEENATNSKDKNKSTSGIFKKCKTSQSVIKQYLVTKLNQIQGNNDENKSNELEDAKLHKKSLSQNSKNSKKGSIKEKNKGGITNQENNEKQNKTSQKVPILFQILSNVYLCLFKTLNIYIDI